MSKSKKFGKRKAVKCTICGHSFTNKGCLDKHKSAIHFNNNKKFNYYNNNKNLLKKFIKFIIKLVFLINENIEIKNYIGDKFEQRKAQNNLLNNKKEIPDDSSENPQKDTWVLSEKFHNIEKKINKENSSVTSWANDNIEELNWGQNIEDKINALRHENKIKEEREKAKQEEELKQYGEILNFLSQFADKKKNEQIDIKIKRNIIQTIKEGGREILIKSINNKYGENNEIIENLHDPLLEYEGDFAYVKLSVRELFIHSIPDNKMLKFIINYINKKIVDYPTDNEIQQELPLAFSHITRMRSGNPFYGIEFNKIKEIILKYFNNDIHEYQCQFCKKYILNKKRHSMHCKDFKNELQKSPEKILKKFLEENYKKINLNDIDIIVDKFKKISKINVEITCRDLPKFIKNRKNYCLKIKKIRENKEKKQKEQMNKPLQTRRSNNSNQFVRELLKEIDEEMKKLK